MTPSSLPAPSPSWSDGDLLATYRPGSGQRDELLGPSGEVRPQWSEIAPALSGLGLEELLRRGTEARRLLDADGVTYNVSHSGARAVAANGQQAGEADNDRRRAANNFAPSNVSPGVGDRWLLDPLPVVLGSDEWAVLESGLIQRAELLNLVLSDLYGPRTLVERGLIPAELIFGHPEFLRPWSGVSISGPAQLVVYAADIARGADGNWTAFGDRAQAPSGAGYALENRLVVSRVFPSLYRDAQVHRLAPFFRALRAALQATAPKRTTNSPRVVVLSPGPRSETAFEHAYLASYLGFPLAEGADLTVRDGHVLLRTVTGLEPVDVILRRVDSAFCDPLELHPESRLGVPGLVEAARRGNVAVVNPIGSGILEAPALLAFLPRLATTLLGQALRLPSVETWWCGEDADRDEVLAHLSELVVKPAFRTANQPSVFAGELSEAELTDLRDRILAEPHAWVAQRPIDPTTAPTLSDNGFVARPVVLRAFAVARGDSYTAMPGGLTRVAPDARTSRISNQAGALSKDTWVLASEPERLTGFWLQSGDATAAGAPSETIAPRAAENLFWLGRYSERAEDSVRLLRVIHDRRNDFSGGHTGAGRTCLSVLLRALTQVTTTYPGFMSADESIVDDHGDELFAVVVDHRRAGTVAHAVRHLLDAAYAVRDQLSGDTWLFVGALDREILDLSGDGGVEGAASTVAPGPFPVGDRQARVAPALGRVMQSLLALSGLMSESMVRDAGWWFLDAGKRIERGLQLIALLRATLNAERDAPSDSLIIESTLVAAESIITYRRRYRSTARVDTVLDLLLMDSGNPRSLAHTLDELERDIGRIVAAGRSPDPTQRLSREERAVRELQLLIHAADTLQLSVPDADGSGRRSALDAFFADATERLQSLGSMLTTRYFAPLPTQQAIGATAVDPERLVLSAASDGW